MLDDRIDFVELNIESIVVIDEVYFEEDEFDPSVAFAALRQQGLRHMRHILGLNKDHHEQVMLCVIGGE